MTAAADVGVLTAISSSFPVPPPNPMMGVLATAGACYSTVKLTRIPSW